MELRRSSFSKLWATFRWSPWPNPTMATSAPMPTVTPNAVNAVRSFISRRLAAAKSRYSKNLMRTA